MIRQILTLTLSLGAVALHAAGNGDFPTIYNTQEETIPLPDAEKAVQQMNLPEGFRATLFASEPDVQQPIGMAFDSRGRLWVAENYTYSEAAVNFDDDLRDRIVILEDTDHDGRHDQRTVFWDDAERLTSVAPGFGGVFALSLPHLVFIPDRNHDDVPDAAPEILLDGFNYENNRHTLANGLKWGPDGWLYGRQGIQATSWVGKPGAAQAERTPINASIWRYHPVRRVFEMVAQGTTNPWGADWDEHGELFFINTVIGHLWHAIPGAYLERMYGQPFNPHAYEQIDQVADHVHWDTRETWDDIRQGMSSTTSQAGGGHAHTGLMIYQGDNWPREFRNSMFTINFHGKRLNRDIISREGASYVARHAPDFITMEDPYFRGLDLLSGPNGEVFVSDWSDIGECHDQEGIHRSSGRIYRITYGEPATHFRGNLTELANEELVELLAHPNVWFARQARLVLQERAVAGQEMSEVNSQLRAILKSDKDTPLRLRALWALYGTGGAEAGLLRDLLRDRDEHVRVWAIRLLVDEHAPSADLVRQFTSLAENDQSGLVLSYLASALQRVAVEQRWPLAQALAERGEFKGDRVLPLMTWYGIEPAIPNSAGKTIDLVRASELPKVRELATRRVFEDLAGQMEAAHGIVALLAKNNALQKPVLRGMAAGLSGAEKPVAPKSWAAVMPALLKARDGAVQARAVELDALFGSEASQDLLKRKASDSGIAAAERRQALAWLLRIRPAGLPALLAELLADQELAVDAARGLAALGTPETPKLLLSRFDTLDANGRREVIAALVSRPAFAFQLLDAVQRGLVLRDEISAADLRQLRGYDHPGVRRLVDLIWPAENAAGSTAQMFAKYRTLLSSENLARGDSTKGREIYQISCGACHKLYGEGGMVGPELTGSDRHNLDYLLANTLAPSSLVPDAYRVSVVTMKDGRVLNGIVVGRNDQTLTLQTMLERLTLPLPEVSSVGQSELSMMPDGLLEGLTDQQTLDLFSYLMSSAPPSSGK